MSGHRLSDVNPVNTEAHTLRIEKLVPGGLGLARLNDGRIALVGGALPGELVEARLETRKGKLGGMVSRVLEASDDRVDVPRSYPPTMDLGHANYATQLRLKREFVLDALTRIGKLEADVASTHPSPMEWQYRNGAQYLVTPRGLAYRRPESHEPFIVREDPLVTELITLGIPDLDMRELEPATEIAFRASFETDQVVACLIGLGKPRDYFAAREHLRDLGVIGVDFAFASIEGRFREGVTHLWGEESILERYGPFRLSVSAGSFAQVNPAAAGELYARAAELAGSGTDVLDVYGGAGGLGFHLAEHFLSVTVLEVNQAAVDRGRRDAGRLGLTNVAFIQGDAARLVKFQSDLVSLDPPRAGLSDLALEGLLKLRPPRILYVSCDPATWARDVGKLVRDGGYRLEVVQPWDFYPQTHHVEVLSLLTLG